MSQVFLLTGSGRGLGRSISGAVLSAGHSLVATARNPDSLAVVLASREWPIPRCG
jgi:NAD(P)-dependent dehydrogenase (short-subunit alcohol dehydrogenase family)